MKRNNAVEIVRIFAAITLVFVHLMEFFGNARESLNNFLSIYVELFFILSGFFMMRHLDSPLHKEDSTFSFLWGKVKAFWLPLCIANVVQLIINCIVTHVSTLSGVLEKIWHFKWEFLLLQCAGFIQNPQFNGDYLIGPAWFLSAMLLALAVIYPLAKHYRKVYLHVIAPLSIVFIYSGFMQAYGTLNIGNGFLFRIMDAPLRAFAGISVGVLAYAAYRAIQTKTASNEFSLKRIHVLIDTLCWLMLPVSILIGIWGNENSGLFMVLIFPEIVVSSMLGITPVPRFLNRVPDGISGFLGKFSLFIYLTQWSAIFSVMVWMPSLSAGMKILLASLITLVYAAVLYMADAVRHRVPVRSK